MSNTSKPPVAERKFIIQYELPYTHRVQVGILATSPEMALARADERFSNATLWDNTPASPLLFDDYEEQDGASLDFKVVAELHEWPEKDHGVRAYERQQLAMKVCALLAEESDEGVPVESRFLQLIGLAKAATGHEKPKGNPLDHRTAQAKLADAEAEILRLRHLIDNATVLIGLEGGLVQGASSNLPLNVVVFDYDTEGCDESEVFDVPQSGADAGSAVAYVGCHTPLVDAAYIELVNSFLLTTYYEGV